MKPQIKLTYQFIVRNKLILLVLPSILLVFAGLLIGVNESIKITEWYRPLFQKYTDAVANLSVFFLSFSDSSVAYFPESLTISFDKIYIPLHLNFALRYYIYSTLILLLLPGKYLKSVLLLILTFLLYYVLSVLKCTTEVLMVNRDATAVTDFIIALRPLSLLFLLNYKLKLNNFTSSLYGKMKGKINEKLDVPFLTFFSLTILLIPAGRFFELLNLNFFSHFILVISQKINSLLAYNTVIYDNFLILQKYSVYLGKQCLGIGLDIMFVFLVFAIKSNWLHKLIYSVLGVLVMILMNSVRISYILIHLYKNGSYQLAVDAHELSNYFFYSVVFILILIYIFWFRDLKISIKKQFGNV